ncbi:S8 family peptidase [Deinococcus roseus]|uniref:Peptidase S8/S53 domain-containing protein n=1 Tax=Deinococcus roseus TaxID=392414 RepID=A0ABQ2CYD4_9DEIO|nr:S8 family serine peptidase [Deinococcus roseus]GGJ33129.1 hypothetical protein GCM10008938_19240 [Deinococcus roseus]
MKNNTIRFLGLSLALLTAVSCTEQTPVKYAITHVIPNPAVVGSEVAVYGTLPDTPVLLLDDQPLGYRPTNQGLFLQMPLDTLAGLHYLYLGAGSDKQLMTTLELLPRIGNITRQASILTIEGAGWKTSTATAKNVLVEINGHLTAPSELTSGQLNVSIDNTLPYGDLDVRVIVEGKPSASQTFTYQASRVSGTVVLPSEATSASSTTVSRQQATSGKVVLFTVASTAASCLNTLPTQQATVTLHPELKVVQASYSSTTDAAQARKTAASNTCVLGTEYDDVVQVQDGIKQQVLEDTSLGTQWFWPLEGLQQLPAEGGNGVTVAVIDTGVYPHPEFVTQLLPGYDFLDEDSSPVDVSGHGTHVTGLIAASKDLISPAPRAKILPVRVTDPFQAGSVLALSKGILWAVNALPDHPNPNPADILNMSLGIREYSPTLASAVQTAINKGALVVAATGNDGSVLSYPAALDGVVAVTSVSGPKNTYQPSYASRGPNTQLAAFGGDKSADQDNDKIRDGILSTDINGGLPGYSLRNGTSMAAPQVTGIAALLLGQGTPKNLLKETLLNAANDLGVLGLDERYGHGLVQAGLQKDFNKRTYVLALNDQNEVVRWTVVRSDGTYTLNNLPPQTPIKLLAATDHNRNGILAEAGELLSAAIPVSTQPGQTLSDQGLQLNPSDGTHTLYL